MPFPDGSDSLGSDSLGLGSGSGSSGSETALFPADALALPSSTSSFSSSSPLTMSSSSSSSSEKEGEGAYAYAYTSERERKANIDDSNRLRLVSQSGGIRSTERLLRVVSVLEGGYSLSSPIPKGPKSKKEKEKEKEKDSSKGVSAASASAATGAFGGAEGGDCSGRNSSCGNGEIGDRESKFAQKPGDGGLVKGKVKLSKFRFIHSALRSSINCLALAY